MQPYFLPYAGYFRLFAAAERFVIYDCVQFPRRGWVHRNRLADAGGDWRWLTLPIAPAAFDARIDELVFRDDASTDFERQARRFPALADIPDDDLRQALYDFSGTPVDYLERLLRLACRRLDVTRPMLRSSTLGLPPTLRGQQRILAIVEALGARAYVNAPGGRDLYDAATFTERDIELHFLEPWQGDAGSILQTLLSGDAAVAHAASLIRQQSGVTA